MSRRRHLGFVGGMATLLATAPLMAIYEGVSWLFPCAVTVAVVVVAAVAARALRAPAWGQVLAMAAALLVVLTMQFRSGAELLGILPSMATFEHFGALLAQLPGEVREHTTPVPPLDPLMLVTIAGVGVVAILVDLFTVGVRRPALAGLPLLAIYSVPVAVSFDSIPMPLFAVGAAGYLWLLGADNVDRVRRFGRRFTGDGRDVDAWEPSPLAGAGRRLAVIGLLVAVALPLAVPGMTTGLADRFGPGFGPGSGPGSGAGAGRVNLFAELHGQLNLDETVELLRVASDDPDPFYLRLATADQLTDTGFEPSAPSGRSVTQQLSPAVVSRLGITRHAHRAEIEVFGDFAMYLAPTYSELQEVSGLDSRWLYDSSQQIVYSNRSTAGGLTYELAYERPEFDPDRLRRAAPLPPDHDIQVAFAHAPDLPEVREVLDDLIDPAAAPYDQVRGILEFFSRSNGFRYDLETGPETDAPAIVDFLENRVGFCVQYATAMAWLVRSADMPARVAFGFTRGSGSSQERVLTNRNLHAWTEVYFDGFGWVPFDPTPSAQVAGATNPSWAPNPDAPSDPTIPDTGDGPTGDNPNLPSEGAGEDGPPLPDEEGPQGGGPGAGTDSRWAWWWLGATLVILALLAIPAAQRAGMRRRRLRDRLPARLPAAPGMVVSADQTAAVRHRAHLAWEELLDTMVDLAIPVDPTETPRTTSRRLATHADDGDARAAAIRLGAIEEHARYARVPLPPDDLRALLATLRRGLRERVTSAVLIRALLLPPSVWWRWRRGVGEALTRTSQSFTRMSDLLGRVSPWRLVRGARS